MPACPILLLRDAQVDKVALCVLFLVLVVYRILKNLYTTREARLERVNKDGGG